MYGFSIMRPSIFRFCRSSRKGFLPHSCGVFRRWHAPRNFGTFCPEVRLLAVFPQPGYSFSDGHSVSRCCPSMNYPKSTDEKMQSPEFCENCILMKFTLWNLHFAIILYNGSMRRRCVSMALPEHPDSGFPIYATETISQKGTCGEDRRFASVEPHCQRRNENGQQ